MLRITIAFLLALLVGLVVFLPLKLVLGLAGPGLDLSRAEIHGTVWNGSVRGARISGQPLRRVQIRLHPLALFTGRARADWVITDPGLRGRGQAAIDGRGDWSVSHARLAASPDRLGIRPIPGLTETALVDISIERLDYRGGACAQAAGEISASIPGGQAQAFGVALPDMTGPVQCRDGRLAVLVSGESADMTVEAEALVASASSEWQIGVETANPDLANALAFSGFVQTANIWRRNGVTDHAR
ncbi:type II secretion system protein N [Maricaulis sp.]|uniref:type II secretion system protein N n=1 Tax=Maricaulis sp. TaxID=1486257 RepID=UPI003A93F0BB